MEFLVYRYEDIFTDVKIDRLEEQFVNYQLLADSDIPIEVKQKAGLEESDNYCIDDLWGYLKGIKRPGTADFEVDLLFLVAEVILTTPHSNASEERVFSLINKNRTPSKDSLKLDGTLSSLITVKTNVLNPLEWKPTDTLLVDAKKVTAAYNKEHFNNK